MKPYVIFTLVLGRTVMCQVIHWFSQKQTFLSGSFYPVSQLIFYYYIKKQYVLRFKELYNNGLIIKMLPP